jgi:hypothetical protein
VEAQQTLVTPMHIEPTVGTTISCRAKVPASRPAEHYTPRIAANHPARFATELPLMKWQK